MSKHRKFSAYLADWGHWAGYNSDPAETSGPTAWLRMGRLEVFLTWRES